MAAKLLFLYLLAVIGLGVVQAGRSTSYLLIRLVRTFVDGIRGIAPLILDHRDGGGYGSLSQSYSNPADAAGDHGRG